MRRCSTTAGAHTRSRAVTPPWERRRRIGTSGQDAGRSEDLDRRTAAVRGVPRGWSRESTSGTGHPCEDRGLAPFDYIAMMSRSKSTDQVERYCYISDSTGECLEVVRIDDENEMPRKIWIKVGKLPRGDHGMGHRQRNPRPGYRQEPDNPAGILQPRLQGSCNRRGARRSRCRDRVRRDGGAADLRAALEIPNPRALL